MLALQFRCHESAQIVNSRTAHDTLAVGKAAKGGKPEHATCATGLQLRGDGREEMREEREKREGKWSDGGMVG